MADREVLTEVTEFTGELISVGPRFVEIERGFWVNPEHVVAIVDQGGGGCDVWTVGRDVPFEIAAKADTLVAEILADESDECSKFREHSVLLNSVGWRIAEALGDVGPGDTTNDSAGVLVDLERLIAKVPS